MPSWTTCKNGTVCTEASTLGLAPGESIGKAVLPDGSTDHQWQVHYKAGEVTHWTLSYAGKSYEVYNT